MDFISLFPTADLLFHINLTLKIVGDSFFLSRGETTKSENFVSEMLTTLCFRDVQIQWDIQALSFDI